MTDNLTKLLQLEEGLALKAVKDTVGYVVGYGRNVVTRGVSRDEADYLLGNDVRDVRAECAALPWYAGLDSARRGVVEALVFEMGMGGLLSFKKMVAALAAGRFTTAAAELLDSDYARVQVPARAARLAQQLRTGKWVYPPGA